MAGRHQRRGAGPSDDGGMARERVCPLGGGRQNGCPQAGGGVDPWPRPLGHMPEATWRRVTGVSARRPVVFLAGRQQVGPLGFNLFEKHLVYLLFNYW